MSNLLNETLALTLQNAKFSKNSLNIGNDHEAMKPYVKDLKATAEALGIDFKATKYTFRVVVKEGKVSIYGSYIALYAGQPALYWGETVTPLSELKIPVDYLQVEKNFIASFGLPSGEVHLPLMFQKDAKPSLTVLRTNPEKILRDGFVKPRKLAELPKGTYNVTAYGTSEFKGEVKYHVTIEGKGVYSANSAMTRKLTIEGVTITPDKPATLVIKGISGQTSSGNPIVDVDFKVALEDTLPKFDF